MSYSMYSVTLRTVLCLQTIDTLIVLLQRDEVEYSMNLFNTDDGIAGLGDEPFVS